MNEVIHSFNSQSLTMSSREIAGLVESRHADVCRAIDRLMTKGVISGYAPLAYTHEQNGQSCHEFFIGKRDSYILVASVAPSLFFRITKLWKRASGSERVNIDQALLQALVSYDPETGIFHRRVTSNSKAVIGSQPGSFASSGSGKAYLCFNILSKREAAHRWAFIYMEGAAPDQVDHLNGNGCDNRWKNLAASTNIENCRNQRLRSNNSSGCPGVSWHKATGQWRISIGMAGKRVYLGYRKSLEEAVALRKEAEKRAGYSGSHGIKRPLYSSAEIAGKWAIHNIQEAA